MVHLTVLTNRLSVRERIIPIFLAGASGRMEFSFIEVDKIEKGHRLREEEHISTSVWGILRF